VVLSGAITRAEQDKQTLERKYVIYGETRDGFAAEIVAKIKGQVIIITVYML